MNIKNLLFKKKTVPETNNTKEIDVVKLWYVSWRSAKDRWDNDGEKYIEAFTSEEQAKEFHTALVNAYTLLKYWHQASSVSLYTK
jgi:hypothetical protein